VTDVVTLEYYHAVASTAARGCHKKTSAGTLFLIFSFAKYTQVLVSVD